MKSCQILSLGIVLLLFGCSGQTLRKQGYEVHGIDVSHYQKKIDWEKVAGQGVHFAFIKATEAETFQDSFFCENWDAMKEAGIKRGAYHFFRPNLSAEKQAANFIALADLTNGDLPPVLDVEVLGGVSPDYLRQQITIWMGIVENHFKFRPILYTYQHFFNDHLAGHFPGTPVWIARYSHWRKPHLNGDQNWLFWQYGNRGQLDGIVGPVDFNVFRGTTSDLERLCLVRPAPLFDPPPAPVPDADLALSNP